MTRNPNHTWCKHCRQWRDERACRADPYINAEPRDYCPVALEAINAALAEGPTEVTRDPDFSDEPY